MSKVKLSKKYIYKICKEALKEDLHPYGDITSKLLNNKKTLSIQNVQAYIKDGDTFIDNGNFDEAKSSYDKARDLAKQLAGFYRDLNGSFRGMDARIPDEMGDKGRESIKIWAESNARLIALYKRRNQPEVAVPLLVEIIRLMAPTSSKGKEAYKDLIQLGFVETGGGLGDGPWLGGDQYRCRRYCREAKTQTPYRSDAQQHRGDGGTGSGLCWRQSDDQ